MDDIKCPQCKSINVTCETRIGIKFSVNNDCIDVISDFCGICENIRENIKNGKTIRAECDDCGYEFLYHRRDNSERIT